MTPRLNLLPWALLGLAVVAALAITRPSSSVAPAPVAETPVAPSSATSAAPPGSVARPRPTAAGPSELSLLSEEDRRDYLVRIPHGECEEGVKRINELSGLAPTDPKGIRLVGVCLQYGNVAWYKCVLRATDENQAKTCSRRLLVPEH
jgi:hypothetical protein